jgi:hypothetical protein
MDGQPGDKSPDYYHASLRDEVKPASKMSKLQAQSFNPGRLPIKT